MNPRLRSGDRINMHLPGNTLSRMIRKLYDRALNALVLRWGQ